jgi:hypothetical protein
MSDFELMNDSLQGLGRDVFFMWKVTNNWQPEAVLDSPSLKCPSKTLSSWKSYPV